MNRFGEKYSISILGSSHGNNVGVLIDGLPPNIQLNIEEIQTWLERRRPGQSKITTPRTEKDFVKISSGLFNGKTTGQPLLAVVENKNTDSIYYDEIKNTPRPGHADFPAHIKYKGAQDYRGGGSFSGRMTIALIIAGAIARQILKSLKISFKAYTKEIGGKSISNDFLFSHTRLEVYNNNTRVPLSKDSTMLEEIILDAKKKGDSVGGIVECVIENLPVGLGEPFFDSIESRLSHLMFSIPAVKGIEFGSGFKAPKMKGSEHNDPFQYDYDKNKVVSKTNNAGGILGGLSNGMPVVFRLAFKPTISILKKQETIDNTTNKTVDLVVKGRHDPCIVPRAVPVVECASACVILDFALLAGLIPSALLTNTSKGE